MLLQTQRLRLRPFQKTDLDQLHQIWTDPDVRKFLWDDQVISLETSASIIERSLEDFCSRNFGFWCLFLKDSEQAIGFTGMREFGEQGEIELLYGLRPQYWNQGYATEASRAVLKHGFEVCRLNQIFAGSDPPNEMSFHVMKRLGMRFAKRMTLNGREAIYYVLESRGDLYGRP